MNQYDMTLIAIAEKQVKIQAVSVEDAAKVVEDLYNKTDILDFRNGDVMPCEECHWCCPDCGGCMHPMGKKLP